MLNALKQSGAKATGSFKKHFNRSLLQLTLLYTVTLAIILLISGMVTYSEFSGRIGKRFGGFQPQISQITQTKAEDGSQTTTVNISVTPLPEPPNKPLNKFGNKLSGVLGNQIGNQPGNLPNIPTAEDVRQDLIQSLIFVNGFLLILASISSYWLARRTLRPIEEAYERQRRFLGDASHELRTPLSILHIELENELRAIGGTNGTSGTGGTTHGSASNIAARERIESKLEEVKRMSGLVNDLLALSRLDEDAPNTKDTLKPVHIETAISKITERLQPLAESHKLILSYERLGSGSEHGSSPSAELHSEKNGPMLNLDEDLFSHAITNLILNAIHYNKPDGHVEIVTKTEGNDVVIEITDTGIGISPEDLKAIFERFYRTDKSRTRKTGGSGLGLSIAQSAIEHMGGKITIESERGKGTTATVRLPIR